MTGRNPRPKVLAFDVFGTVVDWCGTIARDIDGRDYGVDGGEFARAWRAGYQPALQRVREGDLPWTRLDDLHRMILDQILVDFGLQSIDESTRQELNHLWHRLDPWQDVAEGLSLLRSEFLVCTLSNGNLSLLADISRHGSLVWDLILSAENFHHYKPDPETYAGVCDVFGIGPSAMMMVAAHSEDLRAARSIGCQTAFIARPLEYGRKSPTAIEPLQEWDLSADSLVDLARQLEKYWKQE